MYDDGLAVLRSECLVIDFVIVVIGDLSFVGHVVDVDVGRSLGRSGGNVVDVVSLLLLLMVTLVGLLILLTTRENSNWTNVRG